LQDAGLGGVAAETATTSDGGTNILFSIETVIGSIFSDTIYGGGQDDTFQGGDGNDNLLGRGGADFLEGGLGDDFIDGGVGDVGIFGDAGADVLRGGNGDDNMAGQIGRDVLNGGANLDLFVFDVVDIGFDRIRDFSNGEVIDLTFYGIDFSDLAITEVNGSARITFSAGTIQLDNIAAATVDAGDFLFV